MSEGSGGEALGPFPFPLAALSNPQPKVSIPHCHTFVGAHCNLQLMNPFPLELIFCATLGNKTFPHPLAPSLRVIFELRQLIYVSIPPV